MQYRTQFVWCGDVCYNPKEKIARRIFADLKLEDVPYPAILPRVDHTEDVHYVLYSSKPRIWSENNDLFIEVVTPEDPAKHYRKK